MIVCLARCIMGNLVDFIDEEKLEEAQNKIKEQKGNRSLLWSGCWFSKSWRCVCLL